jgi:hypothetical protein
MINNSKWYHWVMIVLAMAITINTKFSKVLKNPSSVVFAGSGDGLKNSFTPLIHVKNSTSYNHFDGMNYPYGEHILFTDNQPLISNTLRFIQRNITEINDNTIGVMNMAMLISLFFSGCLLYGIFRRLGLPHWYSLPISVSVVWLSPQLFRFMGHYALSYMIILLLLLYFLMRFEDRSWKWSLSIFALTFFAPMLHFYYFGISAIFISFFYFIKVWKDRKSMIFYAKHWAIQLIIPFVFFNMIWLKIGNSVTDRPEYPSGFLHYVSVWEGTFLNPGNWIYDFIDKYVTKIREVPEIESVNYIGFAAFLFCLVRLVSWIFSWKIKMFEEDFDFPEKNFLQTAFWASVLLYIFSIGVPFCFPNCESLLAYTGPLKQFRGLGRFSWMFFFVANIVAFYYIYHWGEKIKNVEFRRIFWLIIIVIAAREAYGNAKRISEPASFVQELQQTGEKTEDWLSFVDSSKYQAILPIPYYHLGSEYLGIETAGDAMPFSLFPSYYGNIPSMGVMMSRTSWKQTLSSIPLGMELYREPPVLRELPNQKPLLAIEDKDIHNKMGNPYGGILSKGKKIHENAAFALYELPLNAFQQAIIDKSELVKKEAQNKALFSKNNILTRDTIENYVYKNYDELPSKISYRGKGAMSFDRKETKIVFSGPIPSLKKGKRYNVQFWLNIENGEQSRTGFQIRELDKNGSEIYQWGHNSFHNVVTLDGNWVLIRVSFDSHLDDSTFEINLHNDVRNKGYMYIDELIILPEYELLYKIDGDETMRNGMWFK